MMLCSGWLCWVEMFDIPPELMINSNQMAQYLVPSANKLRTYARR